ncbi:hypothetical protein ACFX2C_009022 [Malus domestica]
MVAHKAIRLELEAIKARKERLADLDHQIIELQCQMSAIAFKFEKDFESNKPRLAGYAAGTKWIQQLQLNKRNPLLKLMQRARSGYSNYNLTKEIHS